MMKELNLAEIKQIQLNILKEVHDFCIKNNLRYYLGGGTLLGAVRHKGYIPWDDDIDIMMPRPDYLKLIKEYKHSCNNYRVYSLETHSNYYYPFAKLSDENTILKEYSNSSFEMGINIDIFPLDGLPTDIKESNEHLKKIFRFRKIFTLKSIKSSKMRGWFKELILLVSRSLLSVYSIKYLLNKISTISQKYDFETSDFIACTVGGYGYKERCRKEIYAKTVLLEFEKENFCSIAGYKEYLENLFGDYLQLPPAEKRISHHKYQAFLK